MTKVQGDKVGARERVRLRRLELDRERIERDQKVDELAESFYVSLASRDTLLDQARGHEAEMGEVISGLADLRESPTRIQRLLDIDAREYRRLTSAAVPASAGQGTTTGE